MITTDQALKLQARLDGELPQAEASELDKLMEREPETRALVQELGQTRAALRGNEPVHPLPESREFYWSKIAAAIQREEAAASVRRPAHTTAWWVRLAVSLAGCTAILLVLFNLSRFGSSDLQTSSLPTAGAIDGVLDDTATITFRSEAEGLTVVWVTND